MSSIYELIYGRAAGAAGGSGDDGHGGSDAGGGSGGGGGGSSGGRRKRPHPDGEYAFDAVENFYDSSASTNGLGQSEQGQDRGSLLLGQQSQQSSDGGLSGFSSTDDQAAAASSPAQPTPNRSLLLDSDDEDYLDATASASDSSAGRSRRRRSKRRRSSLLDMTPERLERKRKKRAREKVRRRFRYGKKWDLAEEVDCGDAVKTRMRRLMDERKEREGVNKKESGEQSSENESDADSGDNTESPGVLDGLLKHMSQDEDPVTMKMESDGEYHTDRSSGGGRTDDDADNVDDDDDAANRGPMSYLKQGHSAPLRNADLEFSYTRDAPAPSRRSIGPGINRTNLPLHSQNPAVARVIPPYSNRARVHGLVDPFFYFPLMSRHGHLSGREGLESTRSNLSRVLPSSYLPPLNTGSGGDSNEGEGKQFPQKAQKVQNGAQIKVNPRNRVNPRNDELHLHQLRRIASSMITGSTGTQPSHREALFRIISLLHSSIALDDSRPIQSSRDRILLQYAREVESNRQLWHKVRVDIMLQLRRLQRDDTTGGKGSKRSELVAFCRQVIDIMDELLGDEPSWMCGPNAIWETTPIRERAKSLRNRIERLYPEKESNGISVGVGCAAAEVVEANKEGEGGRTDDGRKVRFTMDETSDDGLQQTDGRDKNEDEDEEKSGLLPAPPPHRGVIRTSIRGICAADGNKSDDEDVCQPDPYAHMPRGNAHIDPTVVSITISALVSELCAARSVANKERGARTVKDEETAGYQGMSFLSTSQHSAAVEEQPDDLRQGLMNYFDLVIKSFPIYHQKKDLPISALAMAALRRQSFVANDQSPGIYSDDTKLVIDSSDDDSEEDGRPTLTANDKREEEAAVDMVGVAEDIANAGRKLQTDPRLKIFNELHITTVIAGFAAVLPSNAAEIISRPCSFDDMCHRTPFDLMRLMIEDMESKKQIIHDDSATNAISSLGDQRESIKASTLISELLTAAEAASDLVEKTNHSDPAFVSWQLAFLAAATCISSGVVIGTGAQWAASDYYDDDHGDIARRTRADNHAEVRIQTSNCLRGVLEKCSVNENSHGPASPYYHIAISSFLEWKQAVCLLIRRGATRSNNEVHFQSIRMLHAHYTIKWAKSNRSDAAVKRIFDLKSNADVRNDVVSTVLADRLEQAPDDYTHWLYLASSLGSLGESRNSQEEADKIICSVDGCAECPYLQGNVCCDHDARIRRNHDEEWWGNGREWWEQLFFHSTLPPFRHDSDSGDFSSFSEISVALDEHFQSASTKTVSWPNSSGGVGPRQQNLNLDPKWLASAENEADFYHSGSDEDDEADAVKPRRNHAPKKRKTFDDLLPKHISDVCSGGDIFGGTLKELLKPVQEALSIPHSSSLSRNAACVACCKILIASHLLGPSHRFVSDGVSSLASTIMGSGSGRETPDKKSIEYLGLLWLSNQGLNVQKILRDAEINSAT